MSYETRPQTYDETIKILEKKDYRGIAEFILPSVKEADEISLEHTKLSVPDMREMDFLAKINMNNESFILHIEFETVYKSNTQMMKRMLIGSRKNRGYGLLFFNSRMLKKDLSNK